MAKIGIGVIGLGRMGRVYGSYIAAQLPGARLVAVSDSRPEAIQSFTSEVEVPNTYLDYHELLANPDVQAVVVVTPTSTHHEVVIAAAEAGRAIFCEKPAALTLTETDEMIDAVQRKGVMFQVGFMRRFDSAYAMAKRRIDAGEIGDPVVIRSIGRDPFRTSLEFANPAVSGGLVLDMGIHDFDLLRWLMQDEVQRVYTESASLVYPELLNIGDVDNAMINVRFERGGLGNVEVSRTAHYGYDIQCNVIGTKGALQIGYLQETPVLLLNRQGAHHDVVPYFAERFGPAYTAQIAHFVECLRDGKAPMVTSKDARAALQIGLAATRSQHEGRIVYVHEITA
jgi:scyllo-inositol 2-dehydrogenase (NAD+)